MICDTYMTANLCLALSLGSTSLLYARPLPCQIVLALVSYGSLCIPLPSNLCPAWTFPQNPKACEWEWAFVSGIFHSDPSNFPMVECNRNASDGYLALESLCAEIGEAERESRSKKFHNGALASQGAHPTVPSEPTAGPWSSFFITPRYLEGKKRDCLQFRYEFFLTIQIINWSAEVANDWQAYRSTAEV